MRLIQAVKTKNTNGSGPTVVPGVVNGGMATLIPSGAREIRGIAELFQAVERGETTLEGWVSSGRREGRTEDVAWQDLLDGTAVGWRLTIPITPPEVWGAGVTYRRSADFREEGHGFYTGVYDAPRPELFYKASASRSVGPGEPVGRRRDSEFTAAEPEVAVVVSAKGDILGYTLANDISAWDIERENPLYLPQSKVYNACFSCGPAILTPDEIADPYALELTCVVMRGELEVFRGAASTSQLKRRFSEIVEWLLRSNAVPTGTILSTGTGIIQPLGSGLEEGDIVTIDCPQIGALVNPVALV
jgi:2-dehydro-3-deoxy-D-arabinonate dehydratase